MALKELGKKQLEIELLKKRGFPGPAWKIIDPNLKDGNGRKVTILEQCRILEIKKFTYYENLKNEEARIYDEN